VKKTRRGLAQRLAVRLPERLLASPERVLLNVACVLIGISGLIPPEGSAVASWAPFILLNWAGVMIMGGGLSLHGTLTDSRISERVGSLAVWIGGWFYAASLCVDRGTAGTIPALIFFFLGTAAALRLLRSVAFQQRARQYFELHRGKLPPPGDNRGAQ
jgi:hypothetical protein